MLPGREKIERKATTGDRLNKEKNFHCNQGSKIPDNVRCCCSKFLLFRSVVLVRATG